MPLNFSFTLFAFANPTQRTAKREIVKHFSQMIAMQFSNDFIYLFIFIYSYFFKCIYIYVIYCILTFMRLVWLLCFYFVTHSKLYTDAISNCRNNNNWRSLESAYNFDHILISINIFLDLKILSTKTNTCLWYFFFFFFWQSSDQIQDQQQKNFLWKCKRKKKQTKINNLSVRKIGIHT